MMCSVPMQQGEHSYGECNGDHHPFKKNIMNDIYPEKGQACQNQRQHNTMNCTRNRSCNTQPVPIYFYAHPSYKDSH